MHEPAAAASEPRPMVVPPDAPDRGSSYRLVTPYPAPPATNLVSGGSSRTIDSRPSAGKAAFRRGRATGNLRLRPAPRFARKQLLAFRTSLCLGHHGSSAKLTP